jgi:hypothetical protein
VSTGLIVTGVLLVLLPPLSALSSTAQAPSTCATLLATDELTKAAGVAMPMMGPMESEGNQTMCTWMVFGKPGGPKRVTVRFFDPRKSSPAATLAAAFEKHAAEFEDIGGKREVLPKIGQNAAFFNAPPMLLTIVQRADGIARIEATNLSRAEMIAVTRAVATP